MSRLISINTSAGIAPPPPPPPPELLPIVAAELAAFDEAGALLAIELLAALELAAELELATELDVAKELALELLAGSSAGGVLA